MRKILLGLLFGLVAQTAQAATWSSGDYDWRVTGHPNGDTIAAGHGIYGYGRGAQGGRGGAFCMVTSTDDPGDDNATQIPGTLRYCLTEFAEQHDKTTVLIQTGGNIYINPEPINIRSANVSLLGGLAPAPFCIKGAGLIFSGGNSITRDICVRLTDNKFPNGKNAVWSYIDRLYRASDKCDHVVANSEFSGANDGNLSAHTVNQNNATCRVTVQGNLVGPALIGDHSNRPGASSGSQGKVAEFGPCHTPACNQAGHRMLRDITIYNNVFLSGRRRMFRTGGAENLDGRWNLSLGCGTACIQIRESDPGSTQDTRDNMITNNIMVPLFSNNDYAMEFSIHGPLLSAEYYLKKNVIRNGAGDYSEVTRMNSISDGNGWRNPHVRIDVPGANAELPVPAWADVPDYANYDEAWNEILDSVGRRFPEQDVTAAARIQQIHATGGKVPLAQCSDLTPDYESTYVGTCTNATVPGYEEMFSVGPAPELDSDGDGVPNAWEDLMGMNKNVADAHLPFVNFGHVGERGERDLPSTLPAFDVYYEVATRGGIYQVSVVDPDPDPDPDPTPADYTLPEVTGAVVDGSVEWTGLPVSVGGSTCQLGYDAGGILVGCTTPDDIIEVDPSVTEDGGVWWNDAWEIIVAACEWGGTETSRNACHTKLLVDTYGTKRDHRAGVSWDGVWEYSNTQIRNSDGTASRIFEARLPWTSVNITPTAGLQFGFELVEDDRDNGVRTFVPLCNKDNDSDPNAPRGYCTVELE